MQHEVQQALGQKADNWKVNSLEQQLNDYKYKITDLEKGLGNAVGRINNLTNIVQQSIDIIMNDISEKPYTNELLMKIKQYLY